MQHGQRKSAPAVRGGKVQKKNRHALSPDIYEHSFDEIVVERLRPVEGFYHAVSVKDIRRWIACIPDWQTASKGLNAIVMTSGDASAYGRYNNAGIIKISAWRNEGPCEFFERKEWLLDQLGVTVAENKFELEPHQVRPFLLLGTFLHELGHHVDRITTRSQLDASNGEPFAIQYELRRQQELWPAYLSCFGQIG